MIKITKLLCIALSVSLAAGTAVYLPSGAGSAYAEDGSDHEVQYLFDEENGTCEVDYNCILCGDVYIPDIVEHNGKEYPVTHIPECSIQYVSSLYLGANVETISGSVCYFPALTKITVSPDNKMFTVKDGVLFRKSRSYDGEYKDYITIYPTRKEDKEYTIPGDHDDLPLLNSNPYLERIIISEGVEQGLYYYFNNCTGLKSIYFPDTISEVGDNALEGCSALTDIYYGGSIKKWNAISKFKRNGVTIHTDNEKTSGDLVYLLKSDGTCRVSGYKDTIEEYVKIPEKISIEGKEYTVTEIEVGAFCDCEIIKTVEIPLTVQVIDQQAFRNCRNLKNVFTHNSIKAIGVSAFRDCSSLENFEFDNTTESICDYAFAGCTSLKTVYIPAATELIGNFAFYDCRSLEGIDADTRNKFYSSIDGVLYGKSCSMNKAVTGSNLGIESDPDLLRSVLPPDVPGDADRNGQVDIGDLLQISLYLLRDVKLDGAGKRFADCNGDGCADIADLAHMKQYIMKDKVELKKGPAVPCDSCVKMLELVREKTADGSPLDIGYEAAGYEKMFSDLYDVSIFDRGYSCSLKRNMRDAVRKEGYSDDYSIVREVSEESTEEDIANFSRIIDYIDNEAGTDSYYIYDMYKKESNNLFNPWSFPESEDCSDSYGFGESVSDNSYFVEIVLKNDGEEYKKHDGYKDDYIVTYEIVNKTTKYFTSRKPLVSEEIKSELISEYPYHILSYPKIMTIAQKFNKEHTEDYDDDSGVYRYADSDIVYADTSFKRVFYRKYGYFIPQYIFCNKENDHTAKNPKINIHIKSQESSDKIKSEIDDLVLFFQNNGVKITVSDDIDYSVSYNNDYKLDLVNGQFYLKKGAWSVN